MNEERGCREKSLMPGTPEYRHRTKLLEEIRKGKSDFIVYETSSGSYLHTWDAENEEWIDIAVEDEDIAEFTVDERKEYFIDDNTPAWEIEALKQDYVERMVKESQMDNIYLMVHDQTERQSVIAELQEAAKDDQITMSGYMPKFMRKFY